MGRAVELSALAVDGASCSGAGAPGSVDRRPSR
jgi:hypothetical protein